MSKHGNSTLIGGFVVGAIALAIVSILIFSKEKIFVDKDRYVVYFRGSVNGLKIGAPVKLKGVQIGSVSDIQVQFDARSKKVLTPVFIEIEPDLIAPVDGETNKRYDIKTLIDYGLRAQLTLLNVVTGQLYIEVDFLPHTPIKLVGANPKVPEIPVVRSSTEEIQSTVTKVVADIRDLPVKEMFYSSMNTIQHIEKLVSSQQLTESAESLERTISRIERLVIGIESKIDPLSNQSGAAIKELRHALRNINRQSELLGSGSRETLLAIRNAAEQMRSTLLAIENSAGPTSPLYAEVSNTLSELSTAARSIRIMADTFEQHPEALIYGKKQSGID